VNKFRDEFLTYIAKNTPAAKSDPLLQLVGA
jgi:hypothetical protein